MPNPLAKFQPDPATTEAELEDMRRRAWLKQGVVAVRPEEVRDDWLRQALINLAEARYGRRGASAAAGPDPEPEGDR